MRYLLAVLTVLLLPVHVSANMANPFRPGDTAGELGGNVADLEVEHEELVFDLRPFPEHEHVLVRATYVISNDTGEVMDVPLQFVAAGMVSDRTKPEVKLDGKALEHRIVEDAPVRGTWLVSPLEAWKGVPETQSQHTGASLFFDALLPKGRSTIDVNYVVQPARNAGMPDSMGLAHGNRRFNMYSVAYVLEPARDWGEFGAIDLEVKVPGGWEATTAPVVDDEGRLKKASESLPAPVLLVQFRPTYFHSWRAGLGCLLGIFVVALILFGGSRLARKGVSMITGTTPEENRSLAYDLIELSFVAIVGALALPAGVLTMTIVGGSQFTHPGWGYILFFSLLIASPLVGFVAAFVQGLLIVRLRHARRN